MGGTFHIFHVSRPTHRNDPVKRRRVQTGETRLEREEQLLSVFSVGYIQTHTPKYLAVQTALL